MAQVECPATELESCLGGHIGECAVVVVVIDGDSAAILGSLKTLREKARSLGTEDVHPLEVASDKQVDKPVAVVIEGDRGDRDFVADQPRLFGHVAEFAMAQILEELILPEAHHQKVGTAVVVEVQPERVC